MKKTKGFAFYFSSLTLCIAIICTGMALVYFSHSKKSPSDVPVSRRLGFASDYPVSPVFQTELAQRVKKGLTTVKTQNLIKKWTHDVAEDLDMPESILGCLFFQESRFNPLSGHENKGHAQGLGQFLSFSFYEVNNHLDRYTPKNYPLLVKHFGHDIRPIDVLDTVGPNPASYYEIPTAVISSASYLNNRYHQLDRNLRSRGFNPSPQLLWLYSVMAYNKGTRTVLALWNDALREGGVEKVHHLVTDLLKFQQAVEDEIRLERALGRIWEGDAVPKYAAELRLHIQNIQRCSLESTSLLTRNLSSVGEHP